MRRFLASLALLAVVASGQCYIGRLDTVGSTTYDWQNGWHAMQMLVSAPGHGLHAVWMWSFSTSGSSFPDRNMWYNYYDFATRRWMWPDSNPMHGGVRVFTHRAGSGNVDVDPATGAAIVSCHYTGTAGVTPELAKDAAPGAGIFDYADGEPVLGVVQWPRMGVGQNGTIHIFAMPTNYELYYSRIVPGNWPVFEPPLGPIEPSPGFPSFPLAASKVSGKVCLMWEISTDDPEDAYMQTSTDDGATWTVPLQFLPPDAYGGDTVTSFHITSLYPYYDHEDRLHVVANVCPEVNDTTYIIPSQIWHYCSDNNPQWNRIHIATCASEHLLAPVGYNATYADRPCIGEGNDGQLYVAWEQFDSSNVEPTTSRLRAGVWVSGSSDNGLTWPPGLLVTERNSFSHRFPSIVDRMVPGSPDTVCILYMIDSVAGFYVQGEGPVSFNPMVCQFIASPFVGVAEEVMSDECGVMSSEASIVRGFLLLSGAKGDGREANGVLVDATGRRALDLHPGSNDVRALAPGVYFITEHSVFSSQHSGTKAASGERSAVSVRKVMVTR